jgi:hypothetical protein
MVGVGCGRENAKIDTVDVCSRQILGGELEMAKKKKSLLESVPVLILLGILAGAVGSLGIGLMQQRSLTQSSTTSSAAK